MTYRDVAVLDTPKALWMMDDPTPFLDATGNATAASMSAGTVTTGAAIAAGAAYASVFSSANVGTFTPGVFLQGKEQDDFTLEAWVLPVGPQTTTGDQAILSHTGTYDGLTINGLTVSFTTKYNNSVAESRCSYTLPTYAKVYLVGTHTEEKNQLWINGVLVAEQDLTDAQYFGTYTSAATALLMGQTTSTQQIAVNGVGVYGRALQQDVIQKHYDAGIRAVPARHIAPAYQGQVILTEPTAVFLTELWDNNDDWDSGILSSVSIADDLLLPENDSDGISLAGTWLNSFPLDYGGNTSIYGVYLSWDGTGITVETSLDDTTWTVAGNGQRIAAIPANYNPTGKDLSIRVSFAGGKEDDPAFLRSLEVVGLREATIQDIGARTVTITGDATIRPSWEPWEMRDDQGILISGGTVTIPPDTTDDAPTQRTIEFWVKRTGTGAFTTSVTGTQYRNGAASSVTPPRGEWVLWHTVAASNITTNITFTSAAAIVSQIVVYETALTAAQIANIYKSYTGYPTLTVNDANILGVQSPAEAAVIYSHSWAVTGGG